MNQNKIFPFLIALIVLVVALGVVIAQSNQKEKYVPSKTEGTSELVAPITDTKTSTTPTTPITPTPVVSKPTPKPTTPTPTPTKPAVNSYTLAQGAIHNRQSDCWTTINGGVYNVTPFIDNTVN